MPSTNTRNSHTSRHSGMSGYYPFGMQMQGREFAGGIGYRWGFGGKEKNTELRNSISYELRMYQSGLGRFLSTDPAFKKYPEYSTYSFAINSPIGLIELFGGEPLPPALVGLTQERIQGMIPISAPAHNGYFVKVDQYYVLVQPTAVLLSQGTKGFMYWDITQGKGTEGYKWTQFTPLTDNELGRIRAEPYQDFCEYSKMAFVGLVGGAAMFEVGATTRVGRWAFQQTIEAVAESKLQELTGLELPIGVGSRSATNGAVKIAAKSGVQITKHAAERMVERGITEDMVETGIAKGTKYLDPKNGTLNYVLKNGFASGKDLLIGVSQKSGKVTTVLRGNNLVSSRFIPQL